MSRITVTVKDKAGNSAQDTVDYGVMRVSGGIYFGSNADIRPDTLNRTPPVRITSMQQYRSLADGLQYPGYQKQWVADLVSQGKWLNYVSELKYYGATVGVQNFTVEGKSYSVPAPNGTIQRRPGTTFPVAYSYGQVLSGQIDGVLHRLLAQLRSVNGKVNIQLASEVDTDTEFGVSEGGVVYNPDDALDRAVLATKYIANWLKHPPSGISPIPTGVTISMGWAGQWSGETRFSRAHPEDLMSILDYMHWNSYNHSTNWTAEARLRETLIWYRNLGPIARSKNIILSEFGSNASFIPNQAGYMAQMPNALMIVNLEQELRGEGKYVMTNWFGSRDSTWGTLSPKEDGLVALTNMLNSQPYS